MARVFILSGPDVGVDREVSAGAVFGREEGCEIRLRDGSVSRRHCRIEKTESGYEIVDLDSRNGIFRGGERLKRIPLKQGDEFTVGAVLIRFVDQPLSGLDEIELLPEEPAVSVTTTTTVPSAPVSTPSRQAPTPEIGGARKRAAAAKDGVLLFSRIESKPTSVFGDEMGQYGFVTRALFAIGALALAAGLFYGAWKLTSSAPVEEQPVDTTDGK